MKKITFFTLCLTLFLMGNLYSQQTVWVAATAAGTADGSSQANAFGSLTTALVQINSAGDILRVVGTVPAGSQNITAKNFQYTIEGDAAGSTLSGVTGVSRMFTINAASVGQNVTFKNITFSGNNSSIAAGGAVLFSNVAVTINFQNCRFNGNTITSTSAAAGGALVLTGSTVTITDCLFKENTAVRDGGAISIGLAANVTLTRCTFYKNKTTSTTAAQGGGALFVTGATAVVNVNNCTFFQNTTGITDQSYGTIRTNSGTTNVINSLFYDNKANNNLGSTADWGSAPAIGSTLTKSLAQWTNANVTNTNSTISTSIALASSNLTYDDVSGKVKYGLPAPGDATPIGFGNDGKDVGAWDSPNTWTGTTNTDWATATNWYVKGIPDATKEALIVTATNQPIIGATANVKSLTLNASTTLNVNSGSLTVAEAIVNNGTMTLENNANLIQGGATNTNTGNITVKRNSSPLLRLDYTLWSSPVTNAALFLKGFSPNTLDTRFYNYDTTFNTGGVNGAYSEIASPSATNFTAGKGFLIRMPDNADAVTPTAYPGVFSGVPNNGTIPVALVDGAAAGLRYNLVGNPYPSPIRMQNFVFDNTANIQPTLYFWRKTNGTGTAYCTWVAGALVTDPGTFTTNGNAQTVNPADIIQTGQGFFVEAKSGATSLSFNNSQRIANTTGQFFKTKQLATPSKIWLNATNAKGDFSQMAITYFSTATTGVDAFDAKYINDSPIALTSNINGGEYTIQGRPDFDATDVVALYFKTNVDGDYTIAIDHAEGVFASGQDIYLVDAKTGTETNLKTGSYTFNAKDGEDNNRFSLKYQKTLKVDVPVFNDNSISVYTANGSLFVNSKSAAISNVTVYDVQGRVITQKVNVKSTSAVINNLRANNQVLIVKIEGEDNSVVTKKLLN